MARVLGPWRQTALRPFEELYKEMDNLVQQFFGEERGTALEKFAPRLNVAETDNDFEVTVDLPGIRPEDVTVEVQDGQLTIAGARKSETEEKGKTFHRVERSYGEFRRVIPLGAAIDEQKITAEYADGVLKILLPKSEKVKPTRIAVKGPGSK